jgi:50S ribosomal subunit-associated GTPase HflX
MGKQPKATFISAAQKENLSELRELIFQEISQKYYTIYPNYLKEGTNLVHLLSNTQ